jgi:hypothetical protein
MMKCSLIAILAVSSVSALNAQDVLSKETLQAYNAIKKNLLAAAAAMPEDGYSFKATPDVRTFGGLIGHIAEAQTRTCSVLNGAPRQAGAGSKTAKADLVNALQSSFEECDKAYNGLTDATAVQTIKSPRGERSKLGMLVGNIAHDNEEYGYLAVYLRLKGVVPPSSAK